jgi:SAM-dependent methyltransferase
VVKAKSSNWFEEWFNTKYYHDLYRHRDDSEAFEFVRALKNSFDWKSDDVVLDVCCGNGRHAINLERMGMQTWGVDLSVDNIEMAKSNSKFPNRWQVQDVRHLSLPVQFNVILNLFTSFGYFEDDAEHQQMLSHIRQHLLPGGFFIMDFFNVESVREKMVSNEIHQGELTDYHISRSIDSKWVRKEIRFEADGATFVFEEKVRALTPKQIQDMLSQAGFEVVNHLGDYQLSPFVAGSPRSIFISKLLVV